MDEMRNEVEEILRSAENLPNFQIPDQLVHRLMQVPQNAMNEITTLPSRTRWMLVAGIASMVILNSLIMLYYQNNSGSGTELTDVYFSYLNQL